MIVARPTLSITFGLVLAASLSLKLLAFNGAVGTKPVLTLPELAATLDKHGFETVQHPAVDNDLAWVTGTSGGCGIQAAEVVAQGWHQSLVEQVADGNRVLYAFDGETYSKQPTLIPRTYHYWNKLKRYLNLSIQHHPVVAVISTPTCEDVQLRELASSLK